MYYFGGKEKRACRHVPSLSVTLTSPLHCYSCEEASGGGETGEEVVPQSRLREGEEDGGRKVGRAGEGGPREGGVAAEDGGGRATNGWERWG